MSLPQPAPAGQINDGSNIDLPNLDDWAIADLKNLRSLIKCNRVKVKALCSWEAVNEASSHRWFSKNNRTTNNERRHLPHLVLKWRLIETIGKDLYLRVPVRPQRLIKYRSSNWA